MTKVYFTCKRPIGCDDYEHNALDSLSTTVHEEYDLIDTGVIDENGDRIMARQKMEPIGFVRLK